MKIGSRAVFYCFLLFPILFWSGIQMPQPYRVYLGMASMGFLILSMFLWLVRDLQKTDGCWDEFEKLKNDKKFVSYIETEFDLNFKSQMVLGYRPITSRIEKWNEIKDNIEVGE